MQSLFIPGEFTHSEKPDIDHEIQRLMEMYGDSVLKTSFMFLKDKHKAEDAFQEVFLRVFNKMDGFKGESSEKTWIIKITINVCKDMLRSPWFKKVLPSDNITPIYTGANADNNLIKKDENKQLFQKVTELPPVFKEVIILYYYHDYNTTEIASILNTSEGTVRSRLHRAREILKSRIGGRMDRSE